MIRHPQTSTLFPYTTLFRSGKDTRDYLAAAFPELNAWERAGADASSAGMVDAGFENQKELTKMQLDNQKEIAEMQNETQKEIAGRSEERRVGKECRYRWAPYHKKKKKNTSEWNEHIYYYYSFFFFKQKTAYEIGLGIPAEPLFRSLMLGSVLVLMLPLLVWLTPDLRIKKSLLKCNWTIRKRLPRCKMRLKKRLLAFSRRLHARIRKTRYMHKMRCLLINRRSLLLALRLLWKTPIFPSNSRFPRLCAKCLLKLKRLVSILPMTKSKK